MTTGQRRALQELWPRFGIEYAPEPLDLVGVFGRSAPLTVEVGFGNGANLVALAADHPASNFLGLEVHEPGVGACLLGIDKAGINNVRLMCHDAIEVLEHRLPSACMARLNLYFPDPWPKKRHHKRRIVQDSFVKLVACRMQPGGLLHIVTDWPDYAEHITEVLARHPVWVAQAVTPADRTVTRFDARGQRLGHANWERAWALAASD